jgi:hypothetical protein
MVASAAPIFSPSGISSETGMGNDPSFFSMMGVIAVNRASLSSKRTLLI